MLSNRFAAAVLTVFLASVAQAYAGQPASRRQTPTFAERNGEAEAHTDLARGKPVKLYTHVLNGRAPGFRTPGLLYCDPRVVAGEEAQALFVPLPAADWQEGVEYTDEHQRIAEAAQRFASQYNRTIFRARKAQVTRFCPRARLGE